MTLRTFGSFYVREERGSWVFRFNPSQRLRALFGWSSTYRGEVRGEIGNLLVSTNDDANLAYLMSAVLTGLLLVWLASLSPRSPRSGISR